MITRNEAFEVLKKHNKDPFPFPLTILFQEEAEALINLCFLGGR